MRLLLLIVVTLTTAWAKADGYYLNLTEATKPTFPYQRALIAYRAGMETIVVESALNGPPGDYAWIVPLPAPPKNIATDFAQDVDFRLEFFNGTLAKYHPMRRVAFGGALLFVLGIVAAFRRSRTLAFQFIAIGVVGLSVYKLAQPKFWDDEAAGATSAGGVSTLKSLNVGPYHVDVVKSGNGGEMTTWMRKHHAILPPEAQSAADAYVKDGWCFLVANLIGSTGTGSPDPLVVTFPSPNPIYPMRLTGSQGSNVVVELTVVTKETATASPLHTWYSKRINGQDRGPYHPDEIISDPFACLDWGGYTITRLRGEMRPSQMAEDISIGSIPYEPQRITFADRKAYDLCGWYAVIASVGFAAFIVGILCGILRVKPIYGVLATIIVSGLTFVFVGDMYYGKMPLESKFVQIDPGKDFPFDSGRSW